MPRTTVLLMIAPLLTATSCHEQSSVQTPAPEPPHAPVEVDEPNPPAPPPPPSTTATIRASAPELNAGVVTLRPSCTQGAPEVLNGLDDNCNGQVDEGFVQSGDVQITLGWSTGADIDLYVTDPFEEELSLRNTTSSSGGHLDREARGACTDGQTTENVYFPEGSAPRGTYRVAAHYFSDCQAAGATPVTLSIMVGGQPLGVFQAELTPGQRVDLATFTVQ